MLAVIRTTHSRNPWRLVWHGQPVADLHFRTKREAETAARDLMTEMGFSPSQASGL